MPASPISCWLLHGLFLACTLLTWSIESSSAQFQFLDADPVVMKRIAALEENQGLFLGKARIVGDFNDVAKRFNLHRTGPRSRNYSLKMVWAPDRNRALFVGANHGEPHRLNDVWEFDLAALAWVLLYPPDNPRSYDGLGEDASDVVFRDGILATRRGGPAVIGHTWWGVTYDPTNRQMLFMNIWLTKQDEAVKQLGYDPASRYIGPPLWSFLPATGSWTPIKTESPFPQAPFGAMLEYVPELGGAVWHMNNWQMRGTWLYDPLRNTWRKLAVNREANDFKQQAPSRELVAYYDPRLSKIVAQQGKATYQFDLKALKWAKILSVDKDSGLVPYGHDARTSLYYDPVGEGGILLDHVKHEIWAYSLEENAWRKLNPSGDPVPKGERMLAYVDPVLNVLVVIDDADVWVYRHRKVSGVAGANSSVRSTEN